MKLPQPENRTPAGDRLNRLWSLADREEPTPGLVDRTMAACRLETELQHLDTHWTPLEPSPTATENLRQAVILEETLGRLDNHWPGADGLQAPDIGAAVRLEQDLMALAGHWLAATGTPAPSAPVLNELGKVRRESGRTVLFSPVRSGWLGGLAAAAVLTLALVRHSAMVETVPAVEHDLWSLAASETLRTDLEKGLGTEDWSTLSELDAPENLEALLEPDPDLEALGEDIDLLAADLESF